MTSISAAMNTAVSGMLAQQQRAASTANNVANALTPGYDRLITNTAANAGGVSASTRSSGTPVPPGGSNVDLAQEAVDMIETTTAYKANASVFEAGADMWEALSTVLRDKDGDGH